MPKTSKEETPLNGENQDLIRVSKREMEPAIEALTKAFQESPLIRYFTANYSEKAKAHGLRCFLSIGVHIGIKYGEVYATPNFEGVAIWMKSDKLPITTWKTLRSVPFTLMLGFARYGGAKMRPVGDFIDKTHERLAPGLHWYLQVLGVDPKFQGRGYAAKLVRPMLSKIDNQHLPCYLETLDEKNVSIYEHFGFRIIEKSAIPQTPFTNWAMLRDPH